MEAIPIWMKYPAWSIISVKGALSTICVPRFIRCSRPSLAGPNGRKCYTNSANFSSQTMFSSRVPADLVSNRIGRALARLRAARVDVIDITASNPTVLGFPTSDGLFGGLSGPGTSMYRPAPLGLAEARSAVAAHLERQQLSVAPGRVVLTTSTSEAYGYLFKLLCDPGDAVLVPRPSYPLLEHLTRLEGVQLVPYGLEYQGRWEIDLAGLQEGLTPQTRAVLMVNPNNPTGSFVSTGELGAVGNLCRQHDIALIVDEVFGMYPMTGGRRGPSVLDRPTEALTFSLGGLSKAIGLPQLKLGWVVVGGPDSMVEDALARLELICDTYLSVGTPVQLAVGGLLEGGAARTAQIATRVRANYSSLQRIVAAYPAAQLLPVDGGWYAVVQVPATKPEETVVLDLLETDRVLVHPGYFFDFPREAFLVVSLLQVPERFDEGATRMLARISDVGGPVHTR